MSRLGMARELRTTDYGLLTTDYDHVAIRLDFYHNHRHSGRMLSEEVRVGCVA